MPADATPRTSSLSILVALLLAACGIGQDSERNSFERSDPSDWVTVLDPGRASPGYTLTLHRRRIPYLVDLSGHPVHAWPDVRVLGRARLGRDGRLLVIATDDAIEEYDWEGRRRFRFELPEGHFPHHDVIRLRNGNVLLPARADGQPADYLIEIDRSGREVWRWKTADHRERFPTWDDERRDATHVNSVHELGPNPGHDAGDDRFRPGNLLISARNLETIFVVDRGTGEVVWQRSQGLDYQHEATQIPPGRPGAGRILFFNNGYHGRLGQRRSRIEAFDPATGAVGFEFGSPFFFSSVGGSVQSLPNGNFLVSSSHGGRVFELAQDGETVWQFEPPFLPMRALRYPPDHCPQLAALPQRTPKPVRRGTPFIDQERYAFLLPEQRRRHVEGFEEPTLDLGHACREVLIPPGATLAVEYGFDEREFRNGFLETRFEVGLRELGSDARERLLDVPLRWEPGVDVQRTEIDLEAWAWRSAELCLDAPILAGPPGVNPDRAVVWGNPVIRSGPVTEAARAPTPEEERLREEQLRRIGYVQ